MVHDVRIRDRQNYARATGTEPPVEHILQVNHIRAGIHACLCVHAVVGRHNDRAAERSSSRKYLSIIW